MEAPRPALAVTTYGSDKDGLVCSYLFAAGERGQAIAADEAVMWLGAPGAPGAFVWLHFNVSNAAAERFMQQHLALPDPFYESLHDDSGSTRVEQAGDDLVAVLHDVLYDFDFDASHVSTVSLCVERRMLVSARAKPLRSIDRLRESVREGETFRSPVELLAHLLRDQADVMVRIVRDSTSRVNSVEDGLLAQRVGSSRARLGALRRVLVRLQRLLAPEPAALFRLLNRPPAWIGEADAQELRQAAEEFSSAVADCAALVERVKVLQEELQALTGERTNRMLFLLTLFTVLALPFNVIGGLFGMNVGGIPFGDDSAGFWVIVALVTAFTVGVGLWAFGKRPQ
jgi:zinc transporter